MSQSRKHSLLEAVVNNLVGYALSLVVQMTLFPLLGIEVSFGKDVIICSVFAIWSVVRSYVVRRIFNGYHEKNSQKELV